MDKFLLPIFVLAGTGLIATGYSTMNFLPPLVSINLGGSILLVSVVFAYRLWRQTVWKELYVYLNTLYNDVGLFIKQYYDSEPSHNNQKSISIHENMKMFIPLLSQNETSMPKKLRKKAEVFFDKLFDYKRRIEGAVSYNRDGTAYRRWLEINNEFNKDVVLEFKKIKRLLKK